MKISMVLSNGDKKYISEIIDEHPRLVKQVEKIIKEFGNFKKIPKDDPRLNIGWWGARVTTMFDGQEKFDFFIKEIAKQLPAKQRFESSIVSPVLRLQIQNPRDYGFAKRFVESLKGFSHFGILTKAVQNRRMNRIFIGNEDMSSFILEIMCETISFHKNNLN